MQTKKDESGTAGAVASAELLHSAPVYAQPKKDESGTAGAAASAKHSYSAPSYAQAQTPHTMMETAQDYQSIAHLAAMIPGLPAGAERTLMESRLMTAIQNDPQAAKQFVLNNENENKTVAGLVQSDLQKVGHQALGPTFNEQVAQIKKNDQHQPGNIGAVASVVDNSVSIQDGLKGLKPPGMGAIGGTSAELLYSAASYSQTKEDHTGKAGGAASAELLHSVAAYAKDKEDHSGKAGAAASAELLHSVAAYAKPPEEIVGKFGAAASAELLHSTASYTQKDEDHSGKQGAAASTEHLYTAPVYAQVKKDDESGKAGASASVVDNAVGINEGLKGPAPVEEGKMGGAASAALITGGMNDMLAAKKEDPTGKAGGAASAEHITGGLQDMFNAKKEEQPVILASVAEVPVSKPDPKLDMGLGLKSEGHGEGSAIQHVWFDMHDPKRGYSDDNPLHPHEQRSNWQEGKGMDTKGYQQVWHDPKQMFVAKDEPQIVASNEDPLKKKNDDSGTEES
jgi:hypothetical protein